jgi:hypothetical protein
MLFIDKSVGNIVKARAMHIKKVSCRIRRRIGGPKCSDATCEICAARVRVIEHVPHALFIILNDDIFLELILGGLPDDLYNMTECVWSELIENFSWQEYDLFFRAKAIAAKNRTVEQMALYAKYHPAYEILFKIIDYDTWFLNSADEKHYDAYDLAFGLDRNTCTYCNRLYTNTMKTHRGRKVMRPTFDHWFSHSHHPLAGLSFYNLIPSCSVCNSSVRGTKQFLLATHLHPYIDVDTLDNFEYNYHFHKSTNQFDIFIKPMPNSPKVFRTLDDLKLKEIYNAHHSELKDLIMTRESYSEKYIKNMINTYSTARLSHKEAYRLAFGVEYEEKEFYRRPLSKFKKDILKKLNMIDFT